MSKKDLKDLIVAYHAEGKHYREIAELTGTSEQYCRTVCSRAKRKTIQIQLTPEGTCRFCGKQLTHTEGKKRKQFCNLKCRTDFYNRRKMLKGYVCDCDYCGKTFVSFGYSGKRYCNRNCRTLAEKERSD